MNFELHVLVVTVHPDDPELLDYQIECPGVTDECREFVDCDAGRAERDGLLAAAQAGQVPVAHDRRHRLIGGCWMAETDRCYVAGHPGIPDAADGWFTPGRHPIRWESGDGTQIFIAPPRPQRHAA